MIKTWALLLVSSLCTAQVDEQLTVYFRDIRVHAVSKDGDALTGLTAADFVIKEGKRDIQPTYFEEVDLRNGTPTVQQDPSQPTITESFAPALVVYLDTSSMTPAIYSSALTAVETLLKEEISVGTRVKLVHMDHQFAHLTPFTDRGDVLLKALSRIEYKGSFRQVIRNLQDEVDDQLRLQQGVVGSESNLGADLLQDVVNSKELAKLQHFMTYYHNVLGLTHALSSFKGPKSILHVSGGLYLQNNTGTYLSTLPLGNKLARELNQANVTMYSFLQTARTGLTRQQANPNGFQNGGIDNLYSNSLQEQDRQIQSGPMLMAHETGGFFQRLFGSHEALEEMRQFWDRSKHYYRIGYTLDKSQLARKVTVQFRKKRPGSKLIYGKRFQKPEPYAKWSKEKRQLDFEATLLYDPTNRDDLGARFTFYQFPGPKKRLLVPVVVSLGQHQKPRKGYDIGFLAYGPNQYLLDVVNASVPKPPDAPGFHFYQVLLANEQLEKIRFLVRNRDTGAYTLGEQFVASPKETVTGLHISNLVLNQADDFKCLPLNHMTREKNPSFNPREAWDPLLMNGYVVRAKAVPSFRQGERIDLFFHVHELMGDVTKYKITCHLQKGNSAEPVTLNILDLARSEDGSYRIYGKLETNEIQAGEYQLRIKVHHIDGQAEATREIQIKLSSA